MAPQLRRTPLGTREAPITFSTVGLLLFVVAGGVYLVLMQRLSLHRAPSSRSWWLQTWTKGLDSGTYTPEGQILLAKRLPLIILLFVLEIVGVIMFVAYS